jgi:hypothetical protein
MEEDLKFLAIDLLLNGEAPPLSMYVKPLLSTLFFSYLLFLLATLNPTI